MTNVEIHPFMHNVESWPNILPKPCGLNIAGFLTYVWPYFNIMNERIKYYFCQWGEAVVRRRSVKLVFLNFFPKSHEKPSPRVSFLINLQAWGLNIFLHKTPLMAALELSIHFNSFHSLMLKIIFKAKPLKLKTILIKKNF